MATQRRRNLVGRRRRVEEEGEDDGSVTAELGDDSQSEGSGPSEAYDDADADDSDLSDTEGTGITAQPLSRPDVNGNSSPRQETPLASDAAKSGAGFKTMTDTESMMNGLNIPAEAEAGEGIDFDAMAGDNGVQEPEAQPGQQQARNGKVESPAERRRREHEEYKKKRDSDPAFIPNRGAFFMHDHRSAAPGQNGFRPFSRGRGRGRTPSGASLPQTSQPSQGPDSANSPWAHDLHETIIQPEDKTTEMHQNEGSSSVADPSKTQKAPSAQTRVVPSTRSFSRTTQIGNIQIRVLLPGMKAPITFSSVPVKSHTRLPNHRPPLRRDKPVRISLPDQTPRYIFPSTERSFIFIPRALRPNQQRLGRGRGRGGFGSYGGYYSRRTSAYGGSVYTPSVAMSRRSSLAREVARDSIVSPAGSVLSRPPGQMMEAGKPVVRLPGPQQPIANGNHVPTTSTSVPNTPAFTGGASQGYPLPQKPAYRENWSAQIPMHQPRPQKAVSVAGIESPASLTFHAPQQQEQQPFHQQMPPHVNGQPAPPDASNFYTHSRQLSFPSQASGGTPLSNIPERAIHAPAFQPPPYQQQAFQQQQQQPYAVQPAFYYPPAPPPPNGGHPQFPSGMPPTSMLGPVYVQGRQQGAYAVPTVAPAPTSAAPGQANMVAHETNGMVYYYDPSQLYPPVEGYTSASYAVPGMGGMMTPSPDGYYYPQLPPPMYYQPQ